MTLKDAAGKNACVILSRIMSIGLLIQLAGPILYTSGSMNGVHIYWLLILPALLLVVWAGIKKIPLFSQEVVCFFTATAFFLLLSAVSAAWSDSDQTVLYVLKKSLVIMLYLVGVVLLSTVMDEK